MVAYFFRRNNFAIKHPDYLGNADVSSRLHCLSYFGCNFSCLDCYVSKNQIDVTHFGLSRDEFLDEVTSLLPYGEGFKITGGEPSINHTLLRDMNIIVNLGGFIFLDTNGSQHDVIKAALKSQLIEVLGVSIKGLDPQTAAQYSCAPYQDCWSAPLETLEYASKVLGRRVIVTYVYDSFTIDMMQSFANYLSPFPNVIMKLNRRIPLNEHHPDRKTLSKEISKIVDRFLCQNPEWENRIVVVDNDDAVGDSRKALFF